MITNIMIISNSKENTGTIIQTAGSIDVKWSSC